LAAGCGGVSRTISGKPAAGSREGGAAAGENEEKKVVEKALDYAEEAGVPADEAVGHPVDDYQYGFQFLLLSTMLLMTC